MTDREFIEQLSKKVATSWKQEKQEIDARIQRAEDKIEKLEKIIRDRKFIEQNELLKIEKKQKYIKLQPKKADLSDLIKRADKGEKYLKFLIYGNEKNTK